MRRRRDPDSLGMVSGPGVIPANKNFPNLEESQLVEISFQLTTDSHAIVGYADMDPITGEGALHHLFGLGDKFDIRLEGDRRELILGDFGIYLESGKDRALVTTK